ncbi:MAG: hypothetical protein ABIG96_02515 [Candidatus Micrarchaeota archaeon]
MDAKAIVREMMKNGQSKQDIIANLQELGISDAEKYYEDALAEEGKGVISPGLGDEKGSSIFGQDDPEREAKDILENETKPLFGEAKPQKAPASAKEAVEDVPELEITSIGDEGETVENVGGMKREARPEVMRQMPKTSLQSTDELERKLDEMISLLKAVYDIDKRILEANRDMLLRIKSDKG